MHVGKRHKVLAWLSLFFCANIPEAMNMARLPAIYFITGFYDGAEIRKAIRRFTNIDAGCIR